MRPHNGHHKLPHEDDPNGLLEWLLDAGGCLFIAWFVAMLIEALSPGFWHQLAMECLG